MINKDKEKTNIQGCGFVYHINIHKIYWIIFTVTFALKLLSTSKDVIFVRAMHFWLPPKLSCSCGSCWSSGLAPTPFFVCLLTHWGTQLLVKVVIWWFSSLSKMQSSWHMAAGWRSNSPTGEAGRRLASVVLLAAAARTARPSWSHKLFSWVEVCSLWQDTAFRLQARSGGRPR